MSICEWQFAAVAVNSYFVPYCARALSGSGVKVCAAIGFPIGALKLSAKIAEAVSCLQDGAEELDTVLNVGALKSGERQQIVDEWGALGALTHERGAVLKVILETSLLTDEEKRVAAELALAAQVDFVKTSTGFFGGGATVADITLLRSVVKDRARVKASGGIRTLDSAEELIAAGADRLGTSAGVAILKEFVARHGA